jgi:hypothetical protein
VNLRLGARPWDRWKQPRRTLAARPDLTALSAAEVRELEAINSARRPTWDDPFGVAARLGRQRLVTSEHLEAWQPMRQRTPHKYRRREPGLTVIGASLDQASLDRATLEAEVAGMHRA